MKMVMMVVGVGLMVGGCGTQNPFGNDAGESTPAEDEVAIVVYTQTVNQASQDTTIRPTIEVNGNNNVIIVGDRNDPALMPAPVVEEEAPEE